MANRICPCCDGSATKRLSKKGVDYFQCEKCETLFSDPIDNSNMVGGGFEEERNVQQNEERIKRFVSLVGNDSKVLDFGCGHGLLMNDCVTAGLDCKGFDKFNPEYDKMPEGKFNLISLVEVIEHLSFPYGEIDIAYNKLEDNGILYIETSFIDVAKEENIPLEDFFYIEPSVGHATIFSHEGLDLLMKRKGFVPINHINRNVRAYQKKHKMLTLITPTQGNPIALKRTIDSLIGVVDEVIVGSVCIFPEDEEMIKSYNGDISVQLVKLPFNYIFRNGFSDTLNRLASHAKNDWVVYLNVGEVVEKGKDEILNKINGNYNCYYLDHATEKHHWFRVYNRRQIEWSGIIHEELSGDNNRPNTEEPLFTFADTDKDIQDAKYAKVMTDCKELVYFNLYVKLIDQPHLVYKTNEGWLRFSADGYHSFIQRMHEKGDMYEAFVTGDYELLTRSIK